jgi:thymidylate kinase
MPIVEFFGHPGAGKSTLSREVSKQLRRCGYPVREPTYNQVTNLHLVPSLSLRLLKTLRQLMQRPRESYANIRQIWETDQHQVLDLLRTTYYHLYTINEYHRTGSRRECSVFDQGIIQSLWSIFLTANKNIQIEPFLDICPEIRSDWLVVVVDVSRENIRERLEARSINTTRIDLDTELVQSLDHFEKMKRTIRSLEGASASFDVVTVNNDTQERIPEAVSQITATIGA